MRAKQFCVFTTVKSMAKKVHLSPSGFGYSLFKRVTLLFVDSLFIATLTSCPFEFCNHLAEEERAVCFT